MLTRKRGAGRMTERYVIPLAPVTKKNSQTIAINRKTGKPFVLPSKKYQEYEYAAGYFLFRGDQKIKPVKEYPVNVKCLFYMPTRRRVDLTNLLEAIDDILTRYGVVPDDNSNFIAGHDGSRVLYDHDNPRTEITITELKEGEDAQE
jgi:Holliday junction resolvase RusA-like endonuclease